MLMLGKTCYAITDAPMAHVINAASLETEKFINFTKEQGFIATTAHPHFGMQYVMN